MLAGFAAQQLGELALRNDCGFAQQLEPGLVRVLEQVGNGSQGRDVMRFGIFCAYAGSDSGMAGYQSHVDQSPRGLAHRMAADAVLLLQLRLGRQQRADAVASTADVSD